QPLIGQTTGRTGVACLLNELLQLSSRQRLARGKRVLGDGVHGRAEPVRRGGVGAVERCQSRQQGGGTSAHQLAPRFAGRSVGGPFPANRLEGGEQRVGVVGAGQPAGGEHQNEEQGANPSHTVLRLQLGTVARVGIGFLVWGTAAACRGQA